MCAEVRLRPAARHPVTRGGAVASGAASGLGARKLHNKSRLLLLPVLLLLRASTTIITITTITIITRKTIIITTIITIITITTIISITTTFLSFLIFPLPTFFDWS